MSDIEAKLNENWLEEATPYFAGSPAGFVHPCVWSSSDPAIFKLTGTIGSFDQKATFLALAVGDCTVTVTADGVSKTLSVHVGAPFDELRVTSTKQ